MSEEAKEQEKTQGESAQQAAQTQAEPNGVAATEPNGKAEDEASYWKSRSRGWEKQFKELKAEIDELKGAREFATGETKRADDAETALAAASRELAVLKAAATANVDPALLAKMTGDTPEEIAANASMLAESIKASQAYPPTVDNGSQRQRPMTLSDIDSIEDGAQRRAAYAEYYAKNRK